MQTDHSNHSTDRRAFLGTFAGGAAALGLGTLLAPYEAGAEQRIQQQAGDAEGWLARIKGRHRILFDTTEPRGIFPFVWPRVFLSTNAATGSDEKDCTAVVVLRHNAICYAMQDSLWSKYKFAEMFKVAELGPGFRAADAATALSTRNPFWNTAPGDFMMPVMGAVPIGIKDLMASGVLFGACDVAITVFTGMLAMQTGRQPEEIKKEWIDALIPGVQVVPSGVWAVGRAQEHGCSYCFVG